MKRPFVFYAGFLSILFALSFAVYFNSLDNGFHFDDSHHIVNNKHIRSLKNIPRFFVDTETFSDHGGFHYRPLVLITHAINYSMGRLNPAGYHLMNLAFHVGSSFLLFLILKAMLYNASVREGEEGGGLFAAASAALIFAVHPFNSEVINYITARSSVMSGFFYLL